MKRSKEDFSSFIFHLYFVLAIIILSLGQSPIKSTHEEFLQSTFQSHSSAPFRDTQSPSPLSCPPKTINLPPCPRVKTFHKKYLQTHGEQWEKVCTVEEPSYINLRRGLKGTPYYYKINIKEDNFDAAAAAGGGIGFLLNALRFYNKRDSF